MNQDIEINVPLVWGCGLVYQEQTFVDTIRTALSTIETGTFRYLEVGVLKGGTMRAVAEVLAQFPSLTWQVIGLDLPSDPNKLGGRAPALFGQQFKGELRDEYNPDAAGVFLVFKSLKEFASRLLRDTPVHLCFIDGCHCFHCVTSDFLQIENSIAPGGCVIFHDASPLWQEKDKPSNHGQGVRVRDALSGLGLLGGTRPKWKLLYDLTQLTHGPSIFQKV